MSPEVCPNCGADVPRNAKACPGCGADENTGWSESVHASNLNLPDEDFDYGEFVKTEFGERRMKSTNIHWLWWLTAAILILLFLLSVLH